MVLCKGLWYLFCGEYFVFLEVSCWLSWCMLLVYGRGIRLGTWMRYVLEGMVILIHLVETWFCLLLIHDWCMLGTFLEALVGNLVGDICEVLLALGLWMMWHI